MQKHPPEPREAKLAAKAWAAGEYDVGRTLYRKAIEMAKTNTGTSPPSFYLSEWARYEGTIGNRDAFESLSGEAFALEPNAPLLRLAYARELWTEFKDQTACLTAISILEELLAIGIWSLAGRCGSGFGRTCGLGLDQLQSRRRPPSSS